MTDRCPYCSFQPTSMNDFCEKHRPRDPLTREQIETLEQELREAFQRCPFPECVECREQQALLDRVYAALAALRDTPEPPTDCEREAMNRWIDEAWADLKAWVSFARRQMRELPDWEHVPCAPTVAGVAATEAIIARVPKAAPASPAPPSYHEEVMERAHSELDMVTRSLRAEAAPEPPRLPADVAQMREALEAWVTFTEEAHGAMVAVSQVSALHGAPYRGPSWDHALALTKAALASSASSTPQGDT